ncbi:MAG TPA: hypothetical protein VHC22_02925 [Pirellulales bacterium]|nr:hypothetical protein [Pirellulales bacterium]
MGRMLILALVSGAIGALIGSLVGVVLLPYSAPLPEQRVWFVGLCAALTAAAAAIATQVAAARRTRATVERDMLAAVLLGGCAGAALAARLFGDSPRGKQLVLFAAGALLGGLVVRLIHFLRRERSVPRVKTPAARWFQFTLGSLLALMVIASVTLALWVRGPMQRAQALAAIERSGGGRVRFASRAPEWVVQEFGDIARGLFDEVDEISLHDPTDADIARLAAVNNLRSLTIDGRRASGKALKSIAQIKALESLHLGYTAVSSSDLAELKKLPHLRTLQFEVLDDQSLREMAALPEIEGLWLGPNFGGFGTPKAPCPITSEGLAGLAKLAHLRELNLNGLKIADDHLISLGRLTRLKRLHLNETDVTDAGLVHLQSLTQLEQLELCGTSIDGSGFAHLKSLSQLQDLRLGSARVTDLGLAEIATLPALNSLMLNGTRITDSGMAHLRRLSRLTCLNVSGTAVGDPGLADLEGLTKLVLFYHEGTKTTPAGIARLEGIWNERRAAAAAESQVVVGRETTN